MAMVDRAVRKAVAPQLRARFLQLVEKAESRGEAKVARRLAKIADKNGDEALALIAKFHQARIPVTPVKVNPLERFPLFYKNETYVNDLIGGKTPLTGKRLLQEIQAHTDATSGTHQLAKALEALSERLPNQDVQRAATKGFSYYADKNVLDGSLELVETEVAARTAQTIGRFGSNLSRDELKAATELLKGMKGVTDAALRHLGNAEEQVAGLTPKLMVQPGAIGKFFGAGPRANEAVDQQIRETFRQGIARVGEMTVPKVAPPAGPAPISPEKLLEDLLNLKINKTEEWKVFSSETWLKFQESSTNSSSGRISGSSASSGVNLLFAKAQEGSFAGSIGQSGASKAEGKIVKAVDLPIPNTDAHAPMVTVRHIMQNKGDYILVSGGKLHAVNSGDVDGFFHIAEKEVRHGAGLFNAVK